MPLVLRRCQVSNKDGLHEEMRPGIVLELGQKQADFVRAALRLAIGTIEEGLRNLPDNEDFWEDWDSNDIGLLQDAEEDLIEDLDNLNNFFNYWKHR